MRFARELELTAPIVGYQGGLIREIPPPDSTRLGRLLVHTPLAAAVARDVLVWTREHGLDPHVNHLERFILRADDPRADDYSAFMGARAELVPDIVEATTHPVTKVLAVGEPPLPLELARPARARFAGRADVTISHPRFLEFVAPGVSKGRAIRYLSRRLGVPLAATMAIGDQWNDLEMLAEVGHGAAMPTAPLAVRSVARYVAPPVADEGVAAMIEALVLPGAGGRPARGGPACRRGAPGARAVGRGGRPGTHQGRCRGGRRVTVTGPDRPRRRRRPRGSRRGPAQRGHRGPPHRHRVRDRGRARRAGRDRAVVRGEAPAAGQGDHAAPRRHRPGGGDRHG